MKQIVEIRGYKKVVVRDGDPRVAFVLEKPKFKDLELDNTIGCYIENGKLVVVGAWNVITIEPDSANKVRISLKK